MTSATEQIDAMLAQAAPDQGEVLQALRETIAAAAPEAEETISYSMPAFRYRGRALVSYSSFTKHCSLFPMSAELIEQHPEKVGAFATAKGTLQFTPAHPIPADVVTWLVRERIAQIDARIGGQGR
jgi:uncharacterized protein YdhG (YjbR/CyaY superfamily)